MATTTSGEEQLSQLRELLAQSTRRLLGDTITVADDAWPAPSRLPGWSRGHLASHVARQADALVRLAGWARTGERQEMYASAEARDAEIDAGAGRSGLELQVDLDTSANRLTEAFDALDEARRWDQDVELRGGLSMPARLLPLARLLEVVLHHVDLDVGYDVEAIEPATAKWLLEWCALRLRAREECPQLELQSDDGFTLALGNSGRPTLVRGTAPALLGWLTGRLDAGAVRGGEDLRLPGF